jgi:DNA repair protein RadC
MLTKRYGIREENSPAYKAVSGGAVSLSNEELLSLVVSGHKESAKALAEALLKKYNLKQLSVLDISTLIIDFKMSALKSAQMAACFELSRRLEAFQVEQKPKISSPEDVYRRIYPMLREQKKEFFILLCLDTKNHIIRQETISIGSLNANVVHPREVFRIALLESAAHIIVAHNHPSGDPTPSSEDIEITKKLVETGKMMGIDVLDHVIIGDGRHFAMKEAGHI